MKFLIRCSPRLSALICIGSLIAATATAGAAERWVGSWGAALMAPGKYALQGRELRDITLRQVMRLSLGGFQVRIRISNRLGAEPLVIGTASLADASRAGSGALPTGSAPLALLFNGNPGVVVPTGEERASDPLAFTASAGQDVALSIYFKAIPAGQSAHVAAHSTQYIAPGDQTSRPTLDNARSITSWFQVAGIDVVSDAPALIAAGDSITDGSGSGRDANERWTDYLQRRIQDAGAIPMAVINSGIGGNQMLGDEIGEHLLARFGRDVLDRPGATHALVLIGVNDLGRLHRSKNESDQTRRYLLSRLQAGWRQMATQAHEKGICFYVGTITPYGGSRLYKPEPHNEDDRRAMNDWLRNTTLFDGVADFDAAVRDPAAPDRLQAQFDSGDHLHLSPAGYRAMAGAVPLTQVRECRR